MVMHIKSQYNDATKDDEVLDHKYVKDNCCCVIPYN